MYRLKIHLSTIFYGNEESKTPVNQTPTSTGRLCLFIDGIPQLSTVNEHIMTEHEGLKMSYVDQFNEIMHEIRTDATFKPILTEEEKKQLQERRNKKAWVEFENTAVHQTRENGFDVI